MTLALNIATMVWVSGCALDCCSPPPHLQTTRHAHTHAHTHTHTHTRTHTHTHTAINLTPAFSLPGVWTVGFYWDV